MEQLLWQVSELLEDMFQCGLHSIQDELLEHIKSSANECESNGLHKGSQLLGDIYQNLDENRHQLLGEENIEPVLKMLADLSLYLEYCREKMEYELVLSKMHIDAAKQEEEEQNEYKRSETI